MNPVSESEKSLDILQTTGPYPFTLCEEGERVTRGFPEDLLREIGLPYPIDSLERDGPGGVPVPVPDLTKSDSGGTVT